MPILDFLPRNAQSFSNSWRKDFWYHTPPQMALEQGFIFKFAQHHEFLTSFWNVGENGHSTSTVLGLTTQKSNSQPQNGRYGVFIPFQLLIDALTVSGQSQSGMLISPARASIAIACARPIGLESYLFLTAPDKGCRIWVCKWSIHDARHAMRTASSVRFWRHFSTKGPCFFWVIFSIFYISSHTADSQSLNSEWRVV